MAEPDWAGDPRSWLYLARVREVIDGDTLEAELDVGFRWSGTLVLRLMASAAGVQCPELKATDPKVRAAARKARARTQQLLPVGEEFWALTDRPLERDADGGFGRWLSQAIKRDGTNVGDLLLAEGHAVPYARPKPKKAAKPDAGELRVPGGGLRVAGVPEAPGRAGPEGRGSGGEVA